MPSIALPEGPLNYQIEGPASAPVLLLCNSLGTDLRMWEPQLADFSKHFRVLRYDTRGHGQSLVSPGEYDVAQLGADVLALLNSLGIERVHFCGLSMGGLVGQWLAINAGERLERLVLCNTAAKIGNADGWNARIQTVLAGGTQSMVDLREASVSRWFTPAFVAAQSDSVRFITDMLASTLPEGYAACCAAVRDADFHAALSRIQTPTLVVAGIEDAVTTVADAGVLVEGIAAARLLELPAAHLSNVECGDAFTGPVADFLRG
jgi:3-oxoadipate enol-lactonase